MNDHKGQLVDLKTKLEKLVKCLEQARRGREVIITGLPYSSQEKLANVFESICKVIKSKADISNIKYMIRVLAANKYHLSPIIVRFTHPKPRDEFIASKIKNKESLGRRKLNQI